MIAKVNWSKDDLARAFPSGLLNDARAALSVLPEERYSHHCFPVRVGEEVLSIPYRIYVDPPILQTVRVPGRQSELLDCLFTRHRDGFVRQERLGRIIRLQHMWVPCFVVPLVGEYVVEILRVIQETLPNLNTLAYTEFVRANPEFLELTGQRVTSYWDCYYRSIPKQEYPGFVILNFLRALAKNTKQ